MQDYSFFHLDSSCPVESFVCFSKLFFFRKVSKFCFVQRICGFLLRLSIIRLLLNRRVGLSERRVIIFKMHAMLLLLQWTVIQHAWTAVTRNSWSVVAQRSILHRIHSHHRAVHAFTITFISCWQIVACCLFVPSRRKNLGVSTRMRKYFNCEHS